MQVVLFGKPVKRRELPAAELQAALQGTATGGEAYIPLDSLFAPFTYEIAAVELPKLLGASPLCDDASPSSAGVSATGVYGRTASEPSKSSSSCSTSTTCNH